MDNSEHDVLAYMTFPEPVLHQIAQDTNPLQRLNKEVKWRADVGILPNEASITRLIGAVLLEKM